MLILCKTETGSTWHALKLKDADAGAAKTAVVAWPGNADAYSTLNYVMGPDAGAASVRSFALKDADRGRWLDEKTCRASSDTRPELFEVELDAPYRTSQTTASRRSRSKMSHPYSSSIRSNGVLW